MTASTDQTILSANGFVNSIGVNTHVAYAWGSYNNLALLEADLSYLGVTKLRDGLTNIPSAQPVLDGLAAAGYKFDLGVSSSVPASGTAGLQQYVQALNTFEATHPGSIIALEGLNEVNLQPFSYQGSSTLGAAAQFQAAYYNAIKADGALSGIAVYNLTVAYNDASAYSQMGNMSGSSDYANAHAYVSTGLTPQAALQSALSAVLTADPGKSTVITETGYTTQANTPYLGVDQTVQAKSILNTLADAYKDGVSTTYLYELLDLNSSAHDTNPEDHYGLFNSDGTPKLAATAIHNLTTILSDSGTGGHQPTTPLGYSLSNLPASSQSMVLGKSNGAYDLVIWAEPKVWDPTTSTEISNPSRSVTVNLGGVHESVVVYDPLTGTTPIATYSNVSSITVPVSDHPVIIEIDAPAANPVTPAVVSDVTGTAVQIVAQLAPLNADSALSSITLSDTHVLPVASVSTMDYIISNYGKALAAIKGGYSFSITNSTGAWSQTRYFDATGTLTSTTTSNYDSNGVITSKVTVDVDPSSDTILYTNGVKSSEIIVNTSGTKDTISYNTTGQITSETIQNAGGSSSTTVYTNGVKSKVYLTNADGSHTNTFYNITGQAYTTQIQTSSAAGVVTSVTDLHADGSLQYRKVLNANGSTTTDLYNTTGQKTTEVVNYTGGASLTTSYTTSGVVTQTVAVGADHSITTVNYSGGVETSAYITSANGSKETELFSNGKLATDVVQNTDGSSSTTVYANGLKSKVYVTNADGTHTNSFYNITGQAYTTQIQKTSASGQVTSVIDLQADGSLQYSKALNADGSTTTDLYNSAGQKTTEIVNYTSGASVTTYYNTSGIVTQTVAVAADHSTTTTNYSGGVETSAYIVSASGTKETDLFTSGHLTSKTLLNTDGSSSTAAYSGGTETALYVTNADGTHTNTFYNVTGQAYTTQIQKTTASGQVTAVTDLHADGSLQYTKVLHSDGSSTTDLYNSAGQKTSEIVSHTDGSSLTTTYASSGSVTQTVAVASAGDVTTSNFSGGIETSSYIVKTSGVKETQLFDSTGKLSTDAVQNPDGSSSTTVYSAGVKTKMYVTNADGSHDNYYYNATNTEHDSYNAAGNLAYIDILNSNGTHTEAAKIAGVTLKGGATGGDTFSISSAGATSILYTQGADQVVNFHAGTAASHDTLEIAKSLAADYSHLQITQSGADTLVHVAAGDTILLKNVSAASLSHGNFLFV